MLSLYLAALESDGDKKQFRELYRRYHRVMERTALAVLHDPHDAEEAVQEAFLRVIENFSKIDEIPCKDLGGLARYYSEERGHHHSAQAALPPAAGGGLGGFCRAKPGPAGLFVHGAAVCPAAGHLSGGAGDEAGPGLVLGGDRPAAGPDGERREHPAVPGRALLRKIFEEEGIEP